MGNPEDRFSRGEAHLILQDLRYSVFVIMYLICSKIALLLHFINVK